MSSVSKDTNIENIQELKREIDVRMKDVIEKQPDTERKEEALELKAKIESRFNKLLVRYRRILLLEVWRRKI